ncbi:hypothetical protein RND71_040633 [Anisodus tanguticus]|uniref:Uncharacterized protein n=1 Tax=Anisodus tanguticus TaxID=243964 RepID=A0AAE1QTD3_9SOLA|nr:hypothetical protein RND71_040633 [Anisodus tanguticus]
MGGRTFPPKANFQHIYAPSFPTNKDQAAVAPSLPIVFSVELLLAAGMSSNGSFTDVNVIEGDNNSDVASEDCEPFHDSNYPVGEDDIILDQIDESIIESVSIKREKTKIIRIVELRKTSILDMLANFPGHIQEDDCSKLT